MSEGTGSQVRCAARCPRRPLIDDIEGWEGKAVRASRLHHRRRPSAVWAPPRSPLLIGYGPPHLRVAADGAAAFAASYRWHGGGGALDGRRREGGGGGDGGMEPDGDLERLRDSLQTVNHG